MQEMLMQMVGENHKYKVEVVASTDDEGTMLRGPHEDLGFIPNCKDSFEGTIHLKARLNHSAQALQARKKACRASKDILLHSPFTFSFHIHMHTTVFINTIVVVVRFKHYSAGCSNAFWAAYPC